MNDNNQPPRIQPSERAELKAALEASSNDEIFEDIDRCRALYRHPWAQGEDMLYLKVRIAEGKKILAKRMRYALTQL